MSDYAHSVGVESSLAAMKELWKREIYGAMPAFVESYDPETKTCEVSIPLTEYETTDSGDTREKPWPKLSDLPVWFIGGGDVTVTWPLRQGQPVLLISCGRDFTEWMFSDGKEPIAPDDDEAHPEGAWFVLGRLFPEKANTGKANDSDLIITAKEVEVHIKPSGEVQMQAKKIRLGSLDASQALALASETLSAIDAVRAHSNACGAPLGIPPLASLPAIDSKKVFTNG